jgi:hypothetical protein
MKIRSLSSRVLMIAAALAFASAGSLRAQDPQDESAPNPADLARQIRRNMLKIEEDLGKAGTHDATKGEQVQQDLDKLLQGMKSRGDQVIKDIDDIVKQFKSSSSSSSGQGGGKRDSNENQKQSKSRDRNQSDQKSGKPRDQKDKNGQKPQNKKQGGPEDNSKKDENQGENQPGDPKERPGPEKAAHINLNEIWGNLPPELRQKLYDRNFDDFTPEYKVQIDEYFKKTGAPKKNN